MPAARRPSLPLYARCLAFALRRERLCVCDSVAPRTRCPSPAQPTLLGCGADFATFADDETAASFPEQRHVRYTARDARADECERGTRRAGCAAVAAILRPDLPNRGAIPWDDVRAVVEVRQPAQNRPEPPPRGLIAPTSSPLHRDDGEAAFAADPPLGSRARAVDPHDRRSVRGLLGEHGEAAEYSRR